MDKKALFMQLQYGCQITLSIYGFLHSYTAITNLRKYEETTKKAAKWSTEIEKQLNMTRKTQATGLITIILSLLGAVTLLVFSNKLPTWASYSISPAMLFGVLGARQYIKGFWTPTQDSDGKDVGTKIPLPNMEDYNLAVKKTEDLLEVLEYLEYSWLATMVINGFIARA